MENGPLAGARCLTMNAIATPILILNMLSSGSSDCSFVRALPYKFSA